MEKWNLVKDILLTGTGMILVLSQVLTKNPSDLILGAGLTLTLPSVGAHAGALLRGGPGPSSRPQEAPSQPPSSSSSSTPSQGATK